MKMKRNTNKIETEPTMKGKTNNGSVSKLLFARNFSSSSRLTVSPFFLWDTRGKTTRAIFPEKEKRKKRGRDGEKVRKTK